MTADSTVTDKGTAFITDIGMTGAIESCLGVDKEIIIQGFLTQTKQRHDIPEAGPSRLNAVLLKIDPTKKQAVSITPIERLTDIIKNPVR
jgi:hypothetical protein